MSIDTSLSLLAVAGAVVGTVLLSIYWFDRWAQDRLDQHIDTALELLNKPCSCGDPNEVTVSHSPVRCSVKDTSNGV